MRNYSARVGAVMVGAGVLTALLVTPVAANAHTGDMKAVAVCNESTGEYDVSYYLALNKVPGEMEAKTVWRVGADKFEGTPRNGDGMDRGPVGSHGNATVLLGGQSIPGTSTTGPWVYSFTEWSGGYGYGSDTRAEGLKGDCAIPVPVKPEPVTVTGEWVTGEYECGDTTVTETRTVTNVGHVLVDNVWVVDPQPSDRAKTETRERELTEGEIAALECETPVDPVDPVVPVDPPVEPEVPAEPETPAEPEAPTVETPTAPETVTTKTVTNPVTLAETGSEHVSPWIIGGALAGMGVGIIALIRARKRTDS